MKKLRLGSKHVPVIVIGLIIIIGLIYWTLSAPDAKKVNTVNKPTNTKINVAALSKPGEKSIKTILYPGAKILSPLFSDGTVSKMTFETTDSLGGAVNIYWQDLTNRYDSYKTTKAEIKKDDALRQKAYLVTLNGKQGKVEITLWENNKGKTDIEISTSNNFE